MNETIRKYTLDITEEQAIPLPMGAEILTVDTQQNTPQLWALVDPGAPTQERIIHILGDGHPAYHADTTIYISTFRINPGLVFHAFEERVQALD